MVQANALATQVVGKQLTCGRPKCRGILGRTAGAIFTRSITNDQIEAPATVHLRCSCGFVNHILLTPVYVAA